MKAMIRNADPRNAALLLPEAFRRRAEPLRKAEA